MNPAKVHQSIKKGKSASCSINTLRVASKTFSRDNVSNGFFESLSNLKEPDMSTITSSAVFRDKLRDYENIMELARSGAAIPSIELHQSVELLYSVKRDVNDLFSITAAHFISDYKYLSTSGQMS